MFQVMLDPIKGGDRIHWRNVGPGSYPELCGVREKAPDSRAKLHPRAWSLPLALVLLGDSFLFAQQLKIANRIIGGVLRIQYWHDVS